MEEISARAVKAMRHIIHFKFNGNKKRFAESLERMPSGIYCMLSGYRSVPISLITQIITKYKVNAQYIFGRCDLMFFDLKYKNSKNEKENFDLNH